MQSDPTHLFNVWALHDAIIVLHIITVTENSLLIYIVESLLTYGMLECLSLTFIGKHNIAKYIFEI